MIRLETKRFVIRDLLLADLKNIHRLYTIPENDEFNTVGIPETIQTTEKMLAGWLEKQNSFPRSSYIFSTELKESSYFLGIIALKLGTPKFKVGEIWYRIHRSALREGYADEALIKLFSYAFNHLNVHRIESECAVNNIESIRVLEKLGMAREGKKRKFLQVGEEWLDSYMYAILNEDFRTDVSVR